jgi:predicted nucleotidyltransferase
MTLEYPLPIGDNPRMAPIVTLPELKAAEAARRSAAVADLTGVLAAYARAHGGRFILFGSAARGDMRFDSDADVLMDFPPRELDEAWKFAEQACWDRSLELDLIPYRWCKPEFLDHAMRDAKALA